MRKKTAWLSEYHAADSGNDKTHSDGLISIDLFMKNKFSGHNDADVNEGGEGVCIAQIKTTEAETPAE